MQAVPLRRSRIGATAPGRDPRRLASAGIHRYAPVVTVPDPVDDTDPLDELADLRDRSGGSNP